MFDRIARPVRPMNRVMTAGLDRAGARSPPRRPASASGASALDACCGTGDLRSRWRAASGRAAQVIGPRLLAAHARARRGSSRPRRRRGAIGWVRGRRDSRCRCRTTRSPPPPSASACATSPTSSAACASSARVVRPGGRVVCLEITSPSRGRWRASTGVWFDRLVPAARPCLRRRGDSAYSYLPASVRRFPPPVELGARYAARRARATSATGCSRAASSPCTSARCRA